MKENNIKSLFVTLLAILSINISHAGNIYVSPDGSDSNDGDGGGGDAGGWW